VPRLNYSAWPIFNLCRWKSVVDEGGWGLRARTESSGDYEPRPDLSEIVSAIRTSSIRRARSAWYLPPAATPSPSTGGRRGNRMTRPVRITRRIWFVASRSHRRTSIRRILRQPSSRYSQRTVRAYTQRRRSDGSGLGRRNQIVADHNAPCGVDSTWPRHTKRAYRNNYI